MRNKPSHEEWTTKEKEAVFAHLGKFIKAKRLPGKLACLKCIDKSKPALDNREWDEVKYFVKNVIARAESMKQAKKKRKEKSQSLLCLSITRKWG